MSQDLEANLAKSPLLCTVAQRRWRLVGVTFRIIGALSLAREIVVESPGIELTPTSSISTIKRLRVACLALRSIRALSRAADALPENQNELLDRTPSHIAIDVGLDCLSNLVQYRSSEQLRQFGDVEGVASALGTDSQNGLCGDEESITQRRRNYGSNRIQKPPPPMLQIVLDTIRDPIIIVLLLCAVLSLVFGIIKHGLKGWSDGGSVFSAVFVVIAVTSYCKIWPRRQIFKLSGASNDFTIDVIRNGQERHISVFDAVVGDVICLKQGDQVPADGLYVYGNSLQVDASNMIEAMGTNLKDSNDPFLLASSKVIHGSARMLVTAVGMNAARGQMLREFCYDAHHNTPLQMKLHKLAMLIARAGLVAASLVLIVLLIRYFTGHIRDDDGKPEFLEGKTRIHQVCSALIGILATPFTIASTALPEGLLLAVTLIPIAYSTYKMAAAKKALVRNLSAWEEIGSTTVICTNERGNLTTHKLEVSRFWCGQDASVAPNVRELLLQGFVSDNTLVSPGSLTESTELAIQEWIQQMSVDVEQERANCTIAHQKGDPEVMLAKCCKYYDEHGHIKVITDDVREKLEQKILELKSKCLYQKTI